MASSRTLLERIGDLIEGKPGAADAVSDLLRTAPPADWLDASRHREPSVRAAAITAARQRNPDEVRGRLTEMLNDASESVSAACLAAVQHAPDLVTDDGALLTFLERIGDDAAPVVRRLGHRSKFTVRLLAWLEADDYPLEDAAAAALRDALSRAVVLELARILVARSYSDATVLGLLDHHVGLDLAALEPESLADEQRISIARKLSDHPATRFVQLRSALDVVTRGIVDGSVLKEFGRILSDDYRHGELTKGFLLEDSVQRVLARIDSESGSRCALVLGKPGTGKTTLVHAVTAGLAERGWTVVEVIPSEIMVGTKFLGEWETRVQRLIDAARSPRRVVLVMPSVQHLLDVGKSTARDTSASSMLMPLMERGELVVIGEADKDAFAKAAASSPAFRRVFAAFEMMPATIEVTRKLVSLVAQDRSISLPRELVEEIIHLAEGFVTTAEQPGRTLGLLRRALAACPGQPTVRDLLELLSESTGAPVDFLDHSVALDLNETRRFFETRVIGQPDAITAVLDTVTLIKAGLTDPHRPNSVLLFVGPTGVGKTELARALAKFLFGDEGRLLRFDMSEFASYESYERLIGAKNLTGGLLTDAVHAQPFSVVLLDELEKAHANVFDLLLQVFDAGRLTDGRGATVDFRNSVIILTSNVGARVGTRPAAGFGNNMAMPTSDTIHRALEAQFRPEFLGRIDRIVTFRPLDPESAERIVRREIGSVLRRNGITSRRIAVDVDPDVIGFLLAKGYSPAYGARPLKRAIEAQFLLPLARAIASGSIVAGAVVAAGVTNGTISIRVVRDATVTVTGVEPVSERRNRSLGGLRLLMEELEPLTHALAEEKAALLITQGQPRFWEDRRSAFTTLDRIHRLDRLLSDAGRLARDIERTERNRDARRQAAYVAAHHHEFARLRTILDGADLRDAAIFIERLGADAGIDAVGLMLRLYQGLAARLHLEAEHVDDVRTETDDRAVLLVSGAGAAQLLRAESGLHRFRSGDAGARAEEIAAVRVAPFDPDVDSAPVTIKIEYVSLAGRIGGRKRACIRLRKRKRGRCRSSCRPRPHGNVANSKN